MVKVGDRVTVIMGKSEGMKGLVVGIEGRKLWIKLDTSHGKNQYLQFYRSAVKETK